MSGTAARGVVSPSISLATALVSAARLATTTTRTTRVTEPDEDYENPIGEVLDEDTVKDLASAHLTYSIAGLLGIKAGAPWWPFI